MLVVSLVAATMLLRSHSGDESGGLAGTASVTASSTALGSSPREVVSPGGGGWRSDGETTGAWIELSWPETHVLREVTIVRNALGTPGITDGFLTFGDGSMVQVRLSPSSPATVVPITPRKEDRVRFKASAVSPRAHDVTVAQIAVRSDTADGDVVTDDVPGGDAAQRATLTADPTSGASDPRALVDGSGPEATGADWTVDRPTGAGVQLDWSRPRELSRVELAGSPRSSASVTAAHLTFGDGSVLPVGAVTPDPTRPTVVAFMPRVTRSIRLTIDAVQGAGPVTIGELRAYQRGGGPAGPSGSLSPRPPVSPFPGPAACAPTPATPDSPVVVRCPPSGAVVDGLVALSVATLPGYSSVAATVWPADASDATGPTVRATPDPSGAAVLTVDVTAARPGPLTVDVEATGPERDPHQVYLQLYRPGAGPDERVGSSSPAVGRTLVYDDEFDRSLSASHDGSGADYAAAKPTDTGVQSFGDADFADPARDPGALQVVDGRYLRIGVDPLPPGGSTGSGTGHTAGLIASARPGGSGFSAQYGYFEARMLAPAPPGTWPAFWALPSNNLVAPQPAVAEIDAVELYGHQPTGSCQSTHSYQNGKDTGEGQCGDQRFPSARDALAWHTYGVSVTPTDITFTIDGQVVATAPQVPGGGDPLFFLVDLALGGGWPVDLQAVAERAALYVDYVRVYV